MNANDLLERLSKLPLQVSSVELREGITCAACPGVLSVHQFPDHALIRTLNLVMAVVKFQDFTRLEVKALGDFAENNFFRICELLVRENVLSDEALVSFWEAKAQKVLEQADHELAEVRTLLDDKRALFRDSVNSLLEAGMYQSMLEKLEEAQERVLTALLLQAEAKQKLQRKEYRQGVEIAEKLLRVARHVSFPEIAQAKPSFGVSNSASATQPVTA